MGISTQIGPVPVASAGAKWLVPPIGVGRMGSESESTMLRDAPDALPVTATAYDALQRERDELAREHGDVERLWRLEEILSRARVIAAVESGDTVAIGCSVTVLDTGSGEAIDYVIDGTHAAVAGIFTITFGWPMRSCK